MANNKDIIVCGSCIKHDVCKFKEDFASAVDEIKESKFFNKSELGITCSLDCNYYYKAEPVSKDFGLVNTTDEITKVRAGW